MGRFCWNVRCDPPGAVRKGVADSHKLDPIAVARTNWERAGWGDVSQGMVAVTSVMRAHQILLARVESALRPYDLSFSRYELLRLLAFSRTGALPITKASDRLQVHVTSVLTYSGCRFFFTAGSPWYRRVRVARAGATNVNRKPAVNSARSMT